MDDQQVQEFAKLALDVLDAQQRYFKSRDREDLITSKLLEGRLRARAKQVLQKKLF